MTIRLQPASLTLPHCDAWAQAFPDFAIRVLACGTQTPPADDGLSLAFDGATYRPLPGAEFTERTTLWRATRRAGAGKGFLFATFDHGNGYEGFAGTDNPALMARSLAGGDKK